MSEVPSPPRRSMLLRIVVGLCALVVLLVVGIHLGPVRGLVLRSVLPLADRRGVRVEVDRLDYNVFRLTATAHGVRVSATGTPDQPFFVADRVAAAAPAGVLRGLFSLTRVEITGGRVQIVRTAQGSNLPTSSSPSRTEPAPLRLGRISGDLSVDVRDDVARYNLGFPRLVLDVSPTDGRITAGQGRIGIRDQVIEVSRLAGGATFDGRDVTLRDMNLESDATALVINGPLTVITRTPAMNLQMRGSGDVARLAAIATPTRLFTGQITFDGRIAGPFGAPVTDVTVRSERLTRDNLVLTNVDLSSRVDTRRAEIARARFAVAGGNASAAGTVAFDGSGTKLDATWMDVDVPVLLTALVPRPPAFLPAGRTSGALATEGRGFDLAQWNTTADVNVAATDNVANRLALPGQSQLQIRNRSWRLDGRHSVGDVAPVGFSLTGSIRADRRLPMTGALELAPTSVPALAAVLTRTGIANIDPGLFTSGTATATSVVGGELANPALKGTAMIDDLSGSRFAAGPMRVAFDGVPLDQTFQLDLSADSLSVAGQSLADLTAAGTIRGANLVLSGFAATQPGAAGRLQGAGRYQFSTDAYQVEASLENWSVTESASLPARGTLMVTLAGEGTVSRPGGEAKATLTDAYFREVSLGTVTAAAALDGQQATVDVAAPLLNTTAHLLSALTAPYNATLEVQAQALEISRFQQLLAGRNLMLNGTVTATARADGALSTWRDASATVDLAAAEGIVGDLAVTLDGPAQVVYSARSVGTPQLTLRSGGVRAEARGTLPIEPNPGLGAAMTLTVVGDLGDLVSAARASGQVTVPAISGSGPLAVLARIEGSFRSPELSADVDLGPASLTLPNLPTFEGLRVLGHVEDGRAEVQRLVASVEEAEISATAAGPLSWFSSALPAPTDPTSAMATLSARLQNVTANLLARLATGSPVADLTGSLDASIDVSSRVPELSGITGQLQIDRLDLNAAGVTVTQQVPTRVVAEDGVARVAAWNWTGQGATLAVAGQVRLATLETELQGNGELDLRLLSPFLRSEGIATAGTLTPRLLVTGKITEPRFDGDITLSNGEMRLATPRVFVSGLSGMAVVNRDRLTIPTMTGSINGGSLNVGGEVLFLQGASSTATLTAEFRGMALEYPSGLRTELDGSLMLDLGQESEDLERVPLLYGSVRVLSGAYRQPVTVVGGLLAALQSRVGTVPMPVTAPGFTDRLVLDITVATDQDIVIDNNAATLAMDADLRVIGTLGQPALSGRAEVREGGRALLGRNTYQINSGSLDFANPNRIDPDLNVELTTRAGGVQIDLMLTGTLSSPMLALSSPDGEYAQSDLTALLLTGRTLDQLGSADAAVVGDVLVGNLSGEVGQVLGLAGRVVGIDAIRLGAVDNSVLQSDPGAIATETDPTSRLTFTKSLGTNVDVTFSQSLRNGDKQTWVVEYRPSRRLIARLVSDDEDLRRYEFRHDVRIGSNPMGPTSDRVERPDLRVSEIAIEGELPGQNLRDLLSLEPGDRFDFETLQNDRERLEQFYRSQGYLTVRVTARQMQTGDTVAAAFTVQPGPRTRIDVTAEPLSNDVLDAIAGVWADSIAGPLLLDEVRTLVTDRLAADGYPRAMVAVTLNEADGVQVLSVSVQRGQRTSEVVVMFEGVSEELAGELSDRLAATDLVREAPRNPAAVANSVVEGLRERGYMDPRVVVDSPVYEGERATVAVRTQTGPQVLLGPVAIDGSTLDLDQVRAALDLTPGLSYLQAAVDNAQPRLTSFYRQEGFPNAVVTIETTSRPEEGVIAVNVHVEEGARQVVSSIRVEGIRKIDPDVVEREMNLRAGEPARAEDLLRARTRLYALGLFRRVDVTTIPQEADASRQDQLPLTVLATVEEWPMLRFRYGFQVSEERPEEDGGRRRLVPGISADITRRTVFGRAVTVGAATVLQRRERLGRIFINAPTFMSRQIRSSFNVEGERDEFVVNRIAQTLRFSWEQRTKAWDNLTLSYSYKFERVHSFPLVPNPLLPELDVQVNVARLTGAVAWDSRSDPATPTRGSFLSATFDHAPSWTGSQFRFVRLFTQARHFTSWKGTVFASSFQYGHVTPLGGQEVISTERFFTGGGTSIRGLPEDGAGPRDILGPTGGRGLLLFNQEARIPLFRWFQGVTFLDAGNVFGSPSETSLRDLTTSVGVGLRVVTPFALLRVDFGHIVNERINESKGRWTFGLGHVF